MKFEKVNNDKIKVTLSKADLEANDIDMHSFMANSEETQSLFLSVLDKAERDYGFSTDNYKLKVETIATETGTFIFTITRIKDAPTSRKKVKVSKKQDIPNMDYTTLIYNFSNFEDFCNFVDFIHSSNLPNFNKFAKTSSLYSLNNSYYLILSNINSKYSHTKIIYSSITEFGKYVTPVIGLAQKIAESGTVVIKSNAIKTCEKYFIKD